MTVGARRLDRDRDQAFSRSPPFPLGKHRQWSQQQGGSSPDFDICQPNGSNDVAVDLRNERESRVVSSRLANSVGGAGKTAGSEGLGV
jgi:hypothetical protein